MSENCCYSFHDLFFAAIGRSWTDTERKSFSELDQDQKNAEVRRLVSLTSGSWACEDRHWHDGITYTAFWKTAPSDSPAAR
jgi:hypothetical protein